LFSSSASSKPGLLFNQALNICDNSTSEGGSDKHPDGTLEKFAGDSKTEFPEFGFKYSFSNSLSSGNTESFSSLVSVLEDTNSQYRSPENILSSDQLHAQNKTEFDKEAAYYSLVDRIHLNKSKTLLLSTIHSNKKGTISSVHPSQHHQTPSKASIVCINSKLLHSAGSRHRFYIFYLFILYKMRLFTLDSSDVVFVTFQSAFCVNLINSTRKSILPSESFSSFDANFGNSPSFSSVEKITTHPPYFPTEERKSIRALSYSVFSAFFFLIFN
jgi:hypothetical protein